ncbi:MAG: phosphotyrosine protein phosphatase [Micavibrio aeruginosavorus]|uniref:protein-tyrosine-phosphatase n=1 Tax=Micavibrio aeruginosavorus TaxID=349221 RepID=A0A2W5PJ63_9BACT|nr:MAG: phosphotyrosine protein phosphatase [Micavibrio aeruginosavorus]
MAANQEKIGVLFVCTGNICRSPTAEAVFRHLLCESGLEDRFLIDSAGTHGYHIGDPPDPRSIVTALRRGVDMRNLRARQFETDDFGTFDYILAMDAGHHAFLDRLARGAGRGSLSMFLSALRDVPDPYYGGQKDFDLVYELVEEGAKTLLATIRTRHGL